MKTKKEKILWYAGFAFCLASLVVARTAHVESSDKINEPLFRYLCVAEMAIDLENKIDGISLIEKEFIWPQKQAYKKCIIPDVPFIPDSDVLYSVTTSKGLAGSYMLRINLSPSNAILKSIDYFKNYGWKIKGSSSLLRKKKESKNTVILEKNDAELNVTSFWEEENSPKSIVVVFRQPEQKLLL